MGKPQHRKINGVKCIYRTKLNVDGSVNKLKWRLVVKGYSQIFGVDYSETFSPSARLETIRFLLTIATQKYWKIFQLDVKSVFSNDFLQEKIYVLQPQGFSVKRYDNKMYLLKKAFYCLKQVQRTWYDDQLQGLGFKKSLRKINSIFFY